MDYQTHMFRKKDAQAEKKNLQSDETTYGYKSVHEVDPNTC